MDPLKEPEQGGMTDSAAAAGSETPPAKAGATSGSVVAGSSPKKKPPITLKQSMRLCLNAVMAEQDPNGELCCELFRTLVSRKEYPFYYDVIKNPIALDMIEGRVNRGAYASLPAFAADMKLLFSNAMTFNEPQSSVYEDAEQMEKAFNKEYASALRKQQVPPATQAKSPKQPRTPSTASAPKSAPAKEPSRPTSNKPKSSSNRAVEAQKRKRSPDDTQNSTATSSHQIGGAAKRQDVKTKDARNGAAPTGSAAASDAESAAPTPAPSAPSTPGKKAESGSEAGSTSSSPSKPAGKVAAKAASTPATAAATPTTTPAPESSSEDSSELSEEEVLEEEEPEEEEADERVLAAMVAFKEQRNAWHYGKEKPSVASLHTTIHLGTRAALMGRGHTGMPWLQRCMGAENAAAPVL